MGPAGVDRQGWGEDEAWSSRWRGRTEFVANVVAGLAVLATGWLRWVASGPGSSLRGLELADALRSNELVPDAGATVAAGLYAIVASGGLLIASAGFVGGVVVVGRLLGLALVIGSLLVAGLLDWFPFDRWALAPVVVVVAGLTAVGASAAQLRAHR